MNIQKPEERKLFALILMSDPEARKAFVRLKKMGAKNLRLDYMLNFNRDTSRYERNPDPGAWNADLTPSVGVCVLRRENEFSFHEQ